MSHDILGMDEFNEEAEDARITIETDWGHDGRIVDKSVMKLLVDVGESVKEVGSVRIDTFFVVRIRYTLNDGGGGMLTVVSDDMASGLEDERTFEW